MQVSTCLFLPLRVSFSICSLCAWFSLLSPGSFGSWNILLLHLSLLIVGFAVSIASCLRGGSAVAVVTLSFSQGACINTFPVQGDCQNLSTPDVTPFSSRRVVPATCVKSACPGNPSRDVTTLPLSHRRYRSRLFVPQPSGTTTLQAKLAVLAFNRGSSQEPV